jgi:hypothetical protein
MLQEMTDVTHMRLMKRTFSIQALIETKRLSAQELYRNLPYSTQTDKVVYFELKENIGCTINYFVGLSGFLKAADTTFN